MHEPETALTQVAAYWFGLGGDAAPLLLDGWYAGEDGFTWTMGPASRLRLPALPPPAPGGEWLLELRFKPFAAAGAAGQRLAVLVNGVPLGEDVFGEEAVSLYRLGPRCLGPGQAPTVELLHPDAARPCDGGASADSRTLALAFQAVRLVSWAKLPAASATALPPVAIPLPRDALGDAVRAATGLEPEGLARRFESLGHDCEFGLLQRHVGAEPLGLLRFAGLTMADLASGLDDGFARVGDRMEVRTVPTDSGGAEFMVHDPAYRLRLHTFQTTDETRADRVRTQHETRMRFLRDHFGTRLRDADRIFVFQRRGRIARPEALALLARLRRFGPNALLYVDESGDLPSGAVEQLGFRFYHGALASMAPLGRAGDLDLAGWLSLCANAYRLWSAP